SRPFAGATTATTGAMQLARPACGDPVATQRTHGHIVYLITDTTDLRACAHCARRSFSPKATHLRALASNTLKKRNVFLHILPTISVRARIAPVVASFAEGDTFASFSEQHIRASARHIIFQFASIASNTLKKRNVFLHILKICEHREQHIKKTERFFTHS
ncbi:MAG: hypothetical protein PHQ26_08260, partial [Bacteroidales bacterium]|nr:hypothetical protein [Bacteroidales bacterium]